MGGKEGREGRTERNIHIREKHQLIASHTSLDRGWD